MKKILLSVTLGVFLIGFFACGGGGGKYAEVKDAMEDMFDAMDTMTAGLDKAGNADDVVKVLNSFADTMGKLSQRIK